MGTTILVIGKRRGPMDELAEALRASGHDLIQIEDAVEAGRFLRRNTDIEIVVVCRRVIEEETGRRDNLLSSLHRATNAITASLELEEVLNTILAEVQQAMNSQFAFLSLLDESGEDIVLEMSIRADGNLQSNTHIPLLASCTDRVLARGESIILNTPQEDAAWSSETRAQIRNVIASPLRAKGHVVGVLQAVNKKEGDFGEDDRSLLESLGMTSAIAIENARLFSEAEENLRTLQVTQTQLEATARIATAAELAWGFSHQINNALTTLLGMSDLLMLRHDISPQERAYVEAIQKDAWRVANYISRVTDFLRQGRFQRQPVDPNHVASLTLMLVEDILVAEQIEPKLELAPDLPPVEGDFARLQRALLNLIFNGIEAMPGGGELTIHTESRKSDTGSILVDITVQDTGTGIPPDKLDRVFELGFTTKAEDGVAQGIGLGLFDTRNIVQLHGGRITCRSRSGEGAAFTITLPAVTYQE